jgi:hypothetical protein
MKCRWGWLPAGNRVLALRSPRGVCGWAVKPLICTVPASAVSSFANRLHSAHHEPTRQGSQSVSRWLFCKNLNRSRTCGELDEVGPIYSVCHPLRSWGCCESPLVSAQEPANVDIYMAAATATSPPMAAVKPPRQYRTLSRREVEGMIAEGHTIFILNGFVLKADAWLRFHPGGDKAIMHIVGRDATDEVRGLVQPADQAVPLLCHL